MEKLIDIEDRIPALRKRRKRRMTLTFSILLFLFFTALFLVLYLQSSISKIQVLTIQGTQVTAHEEVETLSTLQKEESLWSFRASAIEQKITEHPAIESVTVVRKRWSEVVITVTEFEPIGFRTSEETLLILENGEQVASNLAGSTFGPAIEEFEETQVESRIVKELGELTQQIRMLVSEVTSTPSDSDPNLVTLFMNDGNTVIVSALDFSEKLSYYPAVLQQIPIGQKGIVDMEVGTFFESYDSIYGGKGEELVIDEQQEEVE
ncbi:FtsQ-type POTRA domain-containing protein [Chryseomicrobium sp. FSL W7-1435]|uniref:cell division protein FtsQ/DivIB n=1 Tax=Chryseomicrobium sp. FSL W7-1435 TaxID=2921704 RepID=UPI00315A0D09